MPRRVRKGNRIEPERLEPPAGARDRKKRAPQIIFYNPRSSSKPGSAPDPI